MDVQVAGQSSVMENFDPDDFANASTIACWLESQPDNEKQQCVLASHHNYHVTPD